MSSARAVLTAVSTVALLALPTAASAHGHRNHRTHTVRPGQSIQAAVNAADPGDTVRVLAGDYREDHAGSWAVHITKPVKLIASGKVRLLPNRDQTSGIVAEGVPGGEIDGLDIVGFTVEGFNNNGIWLAYVKNFNIEGNTSIDNQENGIWPTLSANGQVKKNVAYGSKDSALWIEASENVRIIDNDIHHSPTGVEVTLSRDLVIEHNDIHDNTVGIGLYHPGAAGLPQETWPTWPFGNLRVSENHVHDNNLPNTATGGEVALLPPGLGMLILGTSDVSVKENRIERNDFVGVAMMDWCVALGDPGCQATALPAGYEHTAVDATRIVENKFSGNHTGSGPPPFGPLASDVLYIGADLFGPLQPGVNNCQRGNTLVRSHHSPALVIAQPDGALPRCTYDE